MHETDDEMRWLQALLDRSHGGMHAHMRSIVTPERRLDAKRVATYFGGVKQVALATVNADGAPRVAPLDALFIHGRFHVGTAGGAARVRHLRREPRVSLTHVFGDELALTVHGTATLVERDHADAPALEKVWTEVYGSSPFSWADHVVLIRIEPEVMYAHAAEPARFSDGTPEVPRPRPRLVEAAPRARTAPRAKPAARGKPTPRPRRGPKRS